jgi:hypothetical protein
MASQSACHILYGHAPQLLVIVEIVQEVLQLLKAGKTVIFCNEATDTSANCVMPSQGSVDHGVMQGNTFRSVTPSVPDIMIASLRSFTPTLHTDIEN